MAADGTPRAVTPELIARQAQELQDLDLAPARCAELAAEVEGYNRQVAEAAAELEFENEPAEFARALRALRREMPA